MSISSGSIIFVLTSKKLYILLHYSFLLLIQKISILFYRILYNSNRLLTEITIINNKDIITSEY